MSVFESEIVKNYLKDKEKLEKSFIELQDKYSFVNSYYLSKHEGHFIIISQIDEDSIPQ